VGECSGQSLRAFPLIPILTGGPWQVQEIEINYSDCAQSAPIFPDVSQIPNKVSATFKSTKPTSLPQWTRRTVNRTKIHGSTTQCTIYFDIPEPIGPPVFLYYRLTKFYQNHRRYVSSLDTDQLKGVAVDNKTIKNSACDPLTTDPVTGKAYYPCGLIANSLFNDSIQSPDLLNNDTYLMTNKGIAWSSDKVLIQQTKYQPWQVVPPPNWYNRYPNGYTNDNPIPNLNEDEAFMVWLRTAGLPTFSKLARRNDTTAMASGTYQLNIDDCTCLFFVFCSLFPSLFPYLIRTFFSPSFGTHLILYLRLSCH
jgi:LEM3 (ligand-effect modulator 3) family / CDC50 family